MSPGALLLVKHALPVLDASRPAREWRLGPEGEAQALDLAERLRAWLPFRLLSSPEPKAMRTCEILSHALAVPMHEVPGLQEFDRPALPVMSAEEHARVNAGVFARPDRRVLGSESARAALARFSRALLPKIPATATENLVVVTHGTVISLFVADHNDVDPFNVWKALDCASFVVLGLPSFRVLELPAGTKAHLTKGGRP